MCWTKEHLVIQSPMVGMLGISPWMLIGPLLGGAWVPGWCLVGLSLWSFLESHVALGLLSD